LLFHFRFFYLVAGQGTSAEFLKHRMTISSEIRASRVPLAKAGRFLVYRTGKESFVAGERVVTKGEPTIFGSPLRGFLGRRLRYAVGGALDS
jgi:hypothetical protein